MQWGQPLLGPEVVAAAALLGGGAGHREEYLPEKGVYDSVEIFFSITLHYYTSSMMNVVHHLLLRDGYITTCYSLVPRPPGNKATHTDAINSPLC